MAPPFFLIFTAALLSTSSSSSASSGHSLCSKSPNPSSCRRVVSDALNATDYPNTTHLHPDNLLVVQRIITRSLHHCEVAISSATVIHGGETPAVVECRHLLELSHYRLQDSALAVAAGNHDDALTWLSSVLTNHESCLLELQHSNTIQDLEDKVKELKVMASAALAVFTSANFTDENHDSYITRPLSDLPSWVTVGDQRIIRHHHRRADAVVDKRGRGREFTTVQAAVDAAPNNSDTRYVIYVRKGIYNENVFVSGSKKNIMIAGGGFHATIITANRSVVDGYRTYDTGTLISEGDNFLLQDISVQNTAGPAKHQAVALRTNGDKTVINRCLIDGYQDTFYAKKNRQFVRDSTIVGTIDFIFGNAAVVLQNCKIVCRTPMSNQKNIITAQSRTDCNENTGISIQHCLVIPSRDLAQLNGSIPSYLGRPWRKHSRTVYMQSYIHSHIHPEGWLAWDGKFALDTLFYGEYANIGPGACTAGRVKWRGYRRMTNARQAMPFTVKFLLDNRRDQWLKSTGVAFRSGL